MGFYLKTIGENHYRFFGEDSFYVDKSKSVTIDGDTYWKHRKELEVRTAEYFYKKGFHTREIKLKEIDITIKIDVDYYKNVIERESNEDVFLMRLINTQSSEHHDYYGFPKIEIDNRIIKIFTEKTNYYDDYFGTGFLNTNVEDKYWYNYSLIKIPFIQDLLKKGKVDFKIFNYGWNNSLYYSISAVDYCQLPYNQIEGKGLEILQRLGWYGKRENELKNAMRIFEEKIKNLGNAKYNKENNRGGV